MLKYFFIIIFYSISFSQAPRIGFTENNIRTEFSNSKFETNYTDDSHEKYISTWSEDLSYHIGYYFNKEGYSYICRVAYVNQSTASGFIEYLNKNLVIVSDTHWKKYEPSSVINIKFSMEAFKNKFGEQDYLYMFIYY